MTFAAPRPAKDGRIVCAGNAAVDRTFVLNAPAVGGTSNPAALRSGFGGVARNVAENLARLGVAVRLVSQVGDDASGRLLRADCAALGIDVAGLRLSARHPTSEYVAIVDPGRELVIGVSAAPAIDALTVAELGAALRPGPGTAWIFADCTLPPAAVAALLASRRCGGPQLAIDAVSAAKAEHLPPDLRGLDLLFLNLTEARALLRYAADAGPHDMAPALRARGAGAIVLTDGARGALVIERDQTTAVAARPVAPIDVTGAGDALIAGTLYGLLEGETLADAVRTGTLVAQLTLASPATVSRALNRAAIEALRDGVRA